MTDPAQTANPGDEAISRELQELTTAVADLKAELRRSAGAALPRDEAAGWDDDAPAVSHAWVSSLAPPRPAPVRIPRLPLELAFLAVAAVLAGIADLEPIEIAAVMGFAWVIVAIAEWAGSRADRMRAQVYLSPPMSQTSTAQAAVKPDPTWFTPPVEHTLLGARENDQATAITKLPPADDPESTAEHRIGA
jgi:hypothetical protein